MIDRPSSFIRAALVTVAGISVLLTASAALAFPQTQNAWADRYAETPDAGENAGCQLCHANTDRKSVV